MTIPPPISKAAEARTSTWFEQACKKGCLSILKKLTRACLIIEDCGESYVFGGEHDAQFAATVRVEDPAAWPRILLGGSIGAGEAYMLGHWTSPNLTAVVQVFVKNIDVLDSMENGFAAMSNAVLKAYHYSRRNTQEGSRENIQAHYDLGNELFTRFLDPTMMYSSAIFPSEDASLEQASLYKLDRICRKLQLKPTDTLVEIGAGWGAMAVFAAKYYGCRVTTTTISDEQYAYTKALIEQEKLGDRITLLKTDYRELTGQFDKLLSIEMIEAVGHAYLDTYLAKCASLLKPEGLMLIQAITITDQRYERAIKSVDFIQRYIFPGGFLPSITAICTSLTRATDLKLCHLEDITPHYAETLRQWRRNFFHNLRDILALKKYDDKFVRMWDYYLCYCEGAFNERYTGSVQLVFNKPLWQGKSILGELH